MIEKADVATTPKQEALIKEKSEVLQKARNLQSQLASVRAELAAIDHRMIDSGFKLPVLNCW